MYLETNVFLCVYVCAVRTRHWRGGTVLVDGAIFAIKTPSTAIQPTTNNQQHTAKAENPHTRARICVCAGSPTDEPASFRYYERALRAVPSTRASFRPSDIQHVRDYDDSQCTLYELETHNQGSYRITIQSIQASKCHKTSIIGAPIINI